MQFAEFNLNPNISKAINICGYTTPTPIQARCIPDILNKKDIIASAQTGTGKTAAFVLPALHHLSLEKAGRKTRILILTPTRELANQITDATYTYGKFLHLNIVSLVGGTSYRQQLKKLSRPVDMIIATPGRLIDHMENHRLDLSGIEMLILDEADRMLDMGFIDDVKQIAAATPANRQTLLFSATVNDKLAHVVNKLLKSPIKIDLSHEKIAPANIKQELYMADSLQHKILLLKHILGNNNIYKSIIFSATKINADKLAQELCELGFPASPLHGDLKQNVRNRTIEQLRRGKIQYLVATDVAARGIDINDITHVINFDLPKFSEDYVHRIGRTGRAGKSGIAISFALRSDMRHLQKIERFTKQTMQRETIVGLEPSNKKEFQQKRPHQHNKNSSGHQHRKSKTGSYKTKSYSDKSDSYRTKSYSDKSKSDSYKSRSYSDKSKPDSYKSRSYSDKSKPDSYKSRSYSDKSKPDSYKRSYSDKSKPDSYKSRSYSDKSKPDSYKGRSYGDKSKPDSYKTKSFGDKPKTGSYKTKSYSDKPKNNSYKTKSYSDKDKPFGNKSFKNKTNRSKQHSRSD